MASEPYNDNGCIEVKLTNTECGDEHDIRPGGVDGSATYPDSNDPGGIYGGENGTEQVPQSIIDYLRALPCDLPINWKAIRTLFFWAFKWLDTLCQRINNIACQFVLTTLANGEEVEGYLAKITDGNGGCRTGIVKPETPSIFNFVPLTTIHSDGSEQLVQGNLPYTQNVSLPAAIPSDYKALILRVYFELDNRNDDVSTIQLRLTINDQVMGTVEHGGQNVTDDSFWNGDFFVPPNTSDPSVVKINPTIDFNSAGDPDGDVYAITVKVVGYL